MKSHASALAALTQIIGLMSCTWLEHPTNSALQRELLAQSKKGLALARFLGRGADLEVRSFDGTTRVLHLPCCARVDGRSVSRNRLLLVDMTLSPPLNGGDAAGLVRALALYGGPIVMLNTRMTLIARSVLSIQPTVVSLSPDKHTFAFIGVPRGGNPDLDRGLYLGNFRGPDARKVMKIPLPANPKLFETEPMEPSVDWSPDGHKLLVSTGGSILLLNLDTGRARKLADGGLALWAPFGTWISYLTHERGATLLNVDTNESRQIDPGKEISSPLEWSPDGSYLLIYEAAGSHAIEGCLWVYRVTDGAFVPIPNYGQTRPPPHWIQLDGE